MLTCKKVNELYQSCLCMEKEPTSPIIEVEGITGTYTLYKDKIKTHRITIYQMIKELPDSMLEGMSFLQLCLKKDGTLWGDHDSCEQLLLLGLASNNFSYVLPKSLWYALPCNMPYIKINQ